MTALTVVEGAKALGVPTGRLRRWIKEGCPAVNRGRRGRGHALLVDVNAIRQWRDADASTAAMLALAGAIPEVLAAAVVDAWQKTEGVDKRRLAGIIVATWYCGSTALLDHMRTFCPSVPDVSVLPDSIDRLRKIARE